MPQGRRERQFQRRPGRPCRSRAAGAARETVLVSAGTAVPQLCRRRGARDSFGAGWDGSIFCNLQSHPSRSYSLRCFARDLSTPTVEYPVMAGGTNTVGVQSHDFTCLVQFSQIQGPGPIPNQFPTSKYHSPKAPDRLSKKNKKKRPSLAHFRAQDPYWIDGGDQKSSTQVLRSSPKWHQSVFPWCPPRFLNLLRILNLPHILNVLHMPNMLTMSFAEYVHYVEHLRPAEYPQHAACSQHAEHPQHAEYPVNVECFPRANHYWHANNFFDRQRIFNMLTTH